MWFSTTQTGLGGIGKVYYKAIIDGKESEDSDYLIYSTSECIPLRKPWDDPHIRKDIIILGSITKPIEGSRFKTQTRSIIGNLVKNNNEELDKLNFYSINELLENANVNTAEAKVFTECSFYNPSVDQIIFLDNSFDSCEKNDKMIRTSPNLIFNQTKILSEDNISLIVDNLCSYVMTAKDLEKIINASLTPPSIIINSPLNNTKYDKSLIMVDFIIVDEGESNSKFEIYADINNPSMMKASGTVQTNVETKAALLLSDGTHDIWVEATDKFGNMGFSDYITIFVNVSNFIVNISSLEKINYDKSPTVNFTISHKSDSVVNYKIINGVNTISSGTSIVGQKTSINTNLQNGTHQLLVVAKDSSNKTLQSLPYYIIVG